MKTVEQLGFASRCSRLTRLACAAVFMIGLAASPGWGQGRGDGARRAPYIAVSSVRDYFGDHRASTLRDDNYFTRTILVAINATAANAQVATYILGQGQIFRHEFAQISSGDEVRLLTVSAFGGDHNSLCAPSLLPRHCPDPEIAPYVGETIVVASDVPVLVMGAVFREYADFLDDPFEFELLTFAESRRTLDVRQFDCNDPQDFLKISLFCETLRPVPPPRNP